MAETQIHSMVATTLEKVQSLGIWFTKNGKFTMAIIIFQIKTEVKKAMFSILRNLDHPLYQLSCRLMKPIIFWGFSGKQRPGKSGITIS